MKPRHIQRRLMPCAAAAICLVALAACSMQTREQLQSRAEARGTTYDDWAFAGRAGPGFLYQNYTSIPQSPGGGG